MLPSTARRLLSVIGVFWIFLTFSMAPARAHDLSFSAIRVKLETTETIVSVTAHLHALKSADPSGEIAGRLQLSLDGQPFEARNARITVDKPNGILLWQASAAKPAAQISIGAPLFPERPSESTVVTVYRDRQVVHEALLNGSNPAATFGGQEIPGLAVTVQRFLREGVTHILLGPDHVLFLLCLLLLGGSWQQLLKTVTAFSVAHSITLSLAATHIVSLTPRVVEPVIALSIIAVAAGNLWRAREGEVPRAAKDVRPWLAFGFGLLHGFGFAGALSEIGLPAGLLGWALAAFNMGVELGQAAIVLLFAPALYLLIRKRPTIHQPVVWFGSAGVAVVATFWFAQRLFTV